MEVSGQIHAAAALPPVPIIYEAGWAPELVWTLLWKRKSLVPIGNQASDSPASC
jgi:hypothetical protein